MSAATSSTCAPAAAPESVSAPAKRTRPRVPHGARDRLVGFIHLRETGRDEIRYWSMHELQTLEAIEWAPRMTPEIWTILGTGITLAALGIGGFTLLWRYITRAEQRTRADLAAAEQRTRADLAAAEQRTRADLAAAEQRSEARFTELKSDLAAAEKRNEERFIELVSEQKTLGTRMHTLEIQMAKLEGLLEGLREAIAGKRAA